MMLPSSVGAEQEGRICAEYFLFISTSVPALSSEPTSLTLSDKGSLSDEVIMNRKCSALFCA